jgi:hypothetical protein
MIPSRDFALATTFGASIGYPLGAIASFDRVGPQVGQGWNCRGYGAEVQRLKMIASSAPAGEGSKMSGSWRMRQSD